MENDRNTQLQEVEVIKSIYCPKEEIFEINTKQNEQIKLTFYAYVKVPNDFEVAYKVSLDSSETSKLHIQYLPPITLNLTLPFNYPSVKKPNFELICQWLSKLQLTQLCKKLDQLWKDKQNNEIIFEWCNFLKYESLEFLNIDNVLDVTDIHNVHLLYVKDMELKKLQRNGLVSKKLYDPTNPKWSTSGFKKYETDSRARMGLTRSTSMIQLLINHNQERKNYEFEKNYYKCNVCFEEKIGKFCVQFPECEHTCCKDCMSSFCECKIQDGSVLSLKCIEPGCPSLAHPTMVKKLVSPELFEKYDRLLLNIALDSPSTVYCPRKACQYTCERKENDPLARCPQCSYAFCVYCKKVYHGIEPCSFKSAEAKMLISSYQEATGKDRIQLELRYGKKQLQDLVNNARSQDWIEVNSKSCPKCNSHIEKSEGCNKMACTKCDAYFCWLCSTELSHENPYKHFNDPNSRCANKLFFMVEEDDEEPWPDWDVIEATDEESDLSDIEGQQTDTDTEL